MAKKSPCNCRATLDAANNFIVQALGVFRWLGFLAHPIKIVRQGFHPDNYRDDGLFKDWTGFLGLLG